MKINPIAYENLDEIPTDLKKSSPSLLWASPYIYNVDSRYYVVTLNLIDRIVNCVLKTFGKDYLQEQIKKSLQAQTVSWVTPAQYSLTAAKVHAVSSTSLAHVASIEPAQSQTVPKQVTLSYFSHSDGYAFQPMDFDFIKLLGKRLNVDVSIQEVSGEQSSPKPTFIKWIFDSARDNVRASSERLKQKLADADMLDALLISPGSFLPVNNLEPAWHDKIIMCKSGWFNSIIDWSDADTVRRVMLFLMRQTQFSKQTLDSIILPEATKEVTLYYQKVGIASSFSKEDERYFEKICRFFVQPSARVKLVEAQPGQPGNFIITDIGNGQDDATIHRLRLFNAPQYLIAKDAACELPDGVFSEVAYNWVSRVNRFQIAPKATSGSLINWNDPETVRQIAFLCLRLWNITTHTI